MTMAHNEGENLILYWKWRLLEANMPDLNKTIIRNLVQQPPVDKMRDIPISQVTINARRRNYVVEI